MTKPYRWQSPIIKAFNYNNPPNSFLEKNFLCFILGTCSMALLVHSCRFCVAYSLHPKPFLVEYLADFLLKVNTFIILDYELQLHPNPNRQMRSPRPPPRGFKVLPASQTSHQGNPTTHRVSGFPPSAGVVWGDDPHLPLGGPPSEGPGFRPRLGPPGISPPIHTGRRSAPASRREGMGLGSLLWPADATTLPDHGES